MTTVRQLSFSGGVVSPSLWARVDQVKYQTGLRTCRNFIVMRHGGVANRPGTGFIAEVKTSSKTVKLIPFIFNASQTYVLEFGDAYLRIHKNGLQLTEATKAVTGATQANPCVLTVTSHGYSNGQEIQAATVGGMTELNGRNFKVANVTTHTFGLTYMDGTNVNSAAFGAYTSGGTVARVYEIATPYAEADLSTLQYIQSGDIITLVHPTYAPRELSRTGDTAWSFATITFGPSIDGVTGFTASGGVGTTVYYAITAVDADTEEESLPVTYGTTGISNLSWNAVTGAGYYNIYRMLNGQYGWVGLAGGLAFSDSTAYTPDTQDSPPVARLPFNASGDYPSTVSYYQQRMVFANTNNDPEGVYTSRTALPKNMMVSTPSQDDDAITFSLAGRQVNSVKHLLDIGKLLAFTSSGEWQIAGDTAGVLTPTNINPKQYTYNGSANLPPLVIDGSAIYVQARGSVIRDLLFEQSSDGYKGNELSIFAAHLFDNYTLVDWAYQQIPHSVVWAVRDDGLLLGMTYVREHQVVGWHEHLFDGTVENVCVVPQGNEDVLYLVVNRTINGKAVRYIEFMKTRQINDIVDSVFMDCSLTYDGRNASATTMTLSGGTTWASDEDLTLTASVSYFAATDVGNAIWPTGSAGDVIRCTITGYTSPTIVTVRAHKTVPVTMRSVAMAVWSKAVDTVTGLWHIEGEDVSILADGVVSTSPNNDAYVVKSVTNGSVTLNDPHAIIHIGLPITADMETLNIDTLQGQTLADKKKHVGRVTLFVENSRGIFAGSDADNLTELKIRNSEGYDDPVALATGTIDINIAPEWNSTGKILVRQIDPLPLAVLAIVPAGFIAAQ